MSMIDWLIEYSSPSTNLMFIYYASLFTQQHVTQYGDIWYNNIMYNDILHTNNKHTDIYLFNIVLNDTKNGTDS